MKRTIDILISLIGLIVLAPLIIILAMLIKRKLGSPILFKQQRPGLYEKPFLLYKFRTMSNEKDTQGNLLPDHKRLKSFGAFLRKYSLDELPQLINVLKGELSIVGPRPLLMEYLPLYTEEQAKRHNVKPGITGWAQVNGRNAITWEEKFKLDVWYVENQSIILDLYIIMITFWKLVQKSGINKEGHVTMPKFIGYSNKKNDQST